MGHESETAQAIQVVWKIDCEQPHRWGTMRIVRERPSRRHRPPSAMFAFRCNSHDALPIEILSLNIFEGGKVVATSLDGARRTSVRWRIFLLILLIVAINYLDRASLSVAMPTISIEFGF